MMRIVERKVSAGDREIFDLDEFLLRPLYAHLAQDSGHGPQDSPVWFHWDGQALWIIGGTSFPENLRPEPRRAIGVVDWDPATGLSHRRLESSDRSSRREDGSRRGGPAFSRAHGQPRRV